MTLEELAHRLAVMEENLTKQLNYIGELYNALRQQALTHNDYHKKMLKAIEDATRDANDGDDWKA